MYWGEPHFSMGLSSIVSLITSRAVRASTDKIANKNVDREGIRAAAAARPDRLLSLRLEGRVGDDLTRLAVQHAVIINESPSYHVSRATLERWSAEILEMVNLLFRVSYDNYLIIMRAARLVQHAHLNRRDDVGLAYYFLVSAIEAVSSGAIKDEEVKKEEPQEAEWAKLAEENEVVKSLYNAYKAKGRSHYSRQKFARFIIKHCPRDTWEQLEYPEEEDTLYHNEQRPEDWGADLSLRPRIGEPDPYPMFDDPYYIKYQELYGWHDLTVEGRKKLVQTLEDPRKADRIVLSAYDFRSSYTHEGRQPPLSDDRGRTRLFHAVYKPKVYTSEEIRKEESKGFNHLVGLIPSFQLLSFVAKSSLLNYVRFLGNG